MTRSRKRKLRRARAAMAGLPMLAAASGAMAQQAPSGALAEMIVTAQKREENLQQVPFSIQAFSTEKLSQLEVKNFSDFALLVPSLDVRNSSPGFTHIFLRGVASGENGNHSGPLPSVGVYLDEQPITTIQGPLDFHIYDLQRIEVLAGPQGTLYGASSQSGTIRYITNKPKLGQFEARYDLNVNSVAHGDVGGSVEGMVNLPINDMMAVRLVGYWVHDAGYIDNVPGTRDYTTAGGCVSNTVPPSPGCAVSPSRARKNYNDTQTFGGRAALKIDLNDNWTIEPSIIGQDQISHGLYAYDPGVGDLKVQHYSPEFTDDHWIQAGLAVQGKIGNFDINYAGNYLKRDDVIRQDYTDYSFFYDQGGSTWTTPAGDTITNPSQYIEGKDGYQKVSQELRVATPQDWRLRGVTGLFFQSQEHYILQRYKIDGLGTSTAIVDPNPDSLAIYGWPDTIWLTDQKRVDRDYAFFGEATFDIIPDKLSILGGWRWFRTHNSLRGFFGFSNNWSSHTGESQCFSDVQLRGGPCTNLDKSTGKSSAVPKATLTWRIDNEKLLYFTYSQGFRPGGINRKGDLPPYQPDLLTNYEVGWKTTWFDQRLRFNAALFQEDWKKVQYSTILPDSGGLTSIANAGQALLQGIEATVDWAPIDGLTLGAAGSVIHTELSEDYCADPSDPNSCAAKGTQLPVTPNFQGNLLARYEFAVAGFDSHVQSSLSYRGATWSDLLVGDRNAHGKSPAYLLLNLSAGLAKGSYTAELYIKNVTDKRADFYRYDECPGCSSQVYIQTNVPRTIGVEFGQKF